VTATTRAVARFLAASPVALALAVAPAMAQQPSAPGEPTGLQDPTADPAMAVPAIRARLQTFDELFARGDIEALLRSFAPSHPGAHANLRQQLEQCTAVAVRERQSRLLGVPRRVGTQLAVRVEQTTRLGPSGGALCELRSHWLMAFQPAAALGWEPTLQVEVAADAPCADAERFRCPPCNYEIGGVPGWLCAPVAAARGRALEAASFYLLGADVACDVAVEVIGSDSSSDASSATPMAVAARLASALGELLPDSVQQPAEPWAVTAVANAASATAGARCRVDVPSSPPARSIFHVVQRGGLRHVLLVRGGSNALAQHAAAVDALLTSFRLLQNTDDGVGCADQALAHHGGGTLSRGGYHSRDFGVHLTGPDGWTGELRSGGAAFRVAWRNDRDSRLWLVGHRPPTGLVRWDEDAADRWLAHQCKKHGLELPTTAAAPWEQPRDCSGRTRVLHATAAVNGAAAAKSPPRWIRLQLHADLLIVAEGFGHTEADEAAVRQALLTLRRD
jgi:hypothetical protein